MKYKAVVFDYAGVVAGDTASKFDDNISKITGVSVKDYKQVYYRHNDLHNTGIISWEELWKRVLIDLNKVSLLDEVLKFTRNPKKINKSVIKLIEELKSRGYKVALLSNYSNEGGRRMREVLHLDKVFDLILISGEIGLAKPHPDIYLYLMEKLKLQSTEIVFIDDSPKNIKTAKELGIATILCENPKDLNYQLKAMGIL